MFLMLGTGVCLNSFGQTFNGNAQPHINSRTVYLYIVEVENSSEATTIDQYLESFEGKVISASTDIQNHMCIVKVKHFTDQDLLELVLQVGYTAFVKEEMPLPGQRYVYNPDGTWKIKAL